MENIEKLINLYHIGFLICTVLSILFLLCTIIMFFRFNIPKIISDKTGRAMKKSMKVIEEKNARTGALRTAGNTGRMRSYQQQNAASSGRSEQPPASAGSRIVPPPSSTDVLAASGTDVLGTNILGTDVLQTGTGTKGTGHDEVPEMTGCGRDSSDEVTVKEDLPLKFHITRRVVLIHTNEQV